ncbi:MAG: alpha/beta hydrolase [Pseudonocardiales bacterium]
MIAQLGLGAARRVRLELSSGPIAALQAGAVGAPVVLLVPGYTGSKEDFGPIMDPLADAGFHVTSIDLPGQYESPGPDDPAGYSAESLARRLLELAALLGRPAHLVGHSLGGLVSRAAVIAEPSSFADLVLLGSGPAALDGERRMRLEQLAPVFSAVGVSGVYAAMQAVDAAAPGYLAPPPALAEFLEKRFLASTPAMLQGMADTLRSEPDRVQELAVTGVRCLVMHGADDASWSPAVQADMARRLGASYQVISGAAHSPAVERPGETVAELLRFWRSRG